MNVGKLRKLLDNLSPDMELVCYTEDKELVENGSGFRLIEIEDIQIVDARLKRDKNHYATLEIGKSELSQKIALANVTCNF
ncbi:hypothetical protein [Saccharophagus degradans]|uniref:Uncharacterized protein n=2 Tax=Saccharophagus degradans TaxID=86304 RepID=A0AAW7X8Q5_9GAMM|nr:hypothetical protein [Saccharophagus degradans]MDO6422802.1 hypothetical protein [Saccharophagus degradans]MDO6606275.1 hypothetical protein [Saccharophagus degradans]